MERGSYLSGIVIAKAKTPQLHLGLELNNAFVSHCHHVFLCFFYGSLAIPTFLQQPWCTHIWEKPLQSW